MIWQEASTCVISANGHPTGHAYATLIPFWNSWSARRLTLGFWRQICLAFSCHKPLSLCMHNFESSSGIIMPYWRYSVTVYNSKPWASWRLMDFCECMHMQAIFNHTTYYSGVIWSPWQWSMAGVVTIKMWTYSFVSFSVPVWALTLIAVRRHQRKLSLSSYTTSRYLFNMSRSS